MDQEKTPLEKWMYIALEIVACVAILWLLHYFYHIMWSEISIPWSVTLYAILRITAFLWTA